MAEYSASQITIANGFKAVVINSGESPENVRQGDFLFVTGSDPVAINRTYINADNKHVIELTKNWGQGNKNNQPAIVLPSTAEYKTVADALKNANLLVNDNFVAMQDWQTKTGTVTFVNIDGTTTTVKTLKQIESEAQAQLDAYHPHPWAMRKVEFEAHRAANNEKFAASGFVHFGKHLDSENIVTQGMSTYSPSWSLPNSNRFWLGRRNTIAYNAVSKTESAIINMAGVVTNLESLAEDYNGASRLTTVKLPPAEDGTRTYDSATGISVTHATPAIAFASETDTNKVVTDRVDMWGFEAFLREINDADPFVYKNGLIQSQATNINGVATVTDNVRPDTYFAWYEGDDSSTGKGVNWQTATEAQRTAIASDPDNNIYFDDATGKFYQWCVRGRSFAGVGNGDWVGLDSTTEYGLQFGISDPTKAYVQPHGVLDNTLPFTSGFSGGGQVYVSDSTIWSDIPMNDSGVFRGLISKSVYTDKAINGECYFLVCGTVNRLNQGAYHPSFNALGCAQVAHPDYPSTDASGAWYNYQITSESMAFSRAHPLRDGSIGSGTTVGRPDGRFYDAIYASGQGGVCRDMRYSAWGLTQEDFAEADLKVKNGEYRGHELLHRTKFHHQTVTVGGQAVYQSSNAGGTVSALTSDSDSPRDEDNLIFRNLDTTHWLLYGDNGKAMVIPRVSLQNDNARWPYSNNLLILYGSGDVSEEFNSNFPIGTKLWVGAVYPENISVSGEYSHTEVIGDPANILQCDDLKNGWVGSWIPTIPDGNTPWDTFQATRPTKDATVTKVQSDDNGETWLSGNHNFSATKNAPSATSKPLASRVEVWNYTTKTQMTEDSVNSGVYGGVKGLGQVFSTSYFDTLYGASLGFSLTGKLLTQVGGVFAIEAIELDNKLLSIDEKLASENTGSIYPDNKHPMLRLGSPTNNSPAFKALNYNVVENQQGFINYAYTELTYDDAASDWGDDGKIHITDNQATRLDDNGNSVVYGTARIVEPLGWIKNDK